VTCQLICMCVTCILTKLHWMIKVIKQQHKVCGLRKGFVSYIRRYWAYFWHLTIKLEKGRHKMFLRASPSKAQASSWTVIKGRPCKMKERGIILKLHKQDQGYSKKLHMSIFESYHSKYLCVNTSKFLSSYSIHFESSQSNAFVWVITNQNLVFVE
jgi:hypothetical protein